MLAFDVIDRIETVVGKVGHRIERRGGVERIELQTALTDEQLDKALWEVAAIIGSITHGPFKTSIELVS